MWNHTFLAHLQSQLCNVGRVDYFFGPQFPHLVGMLVGLIEGHLSSAWHVIGPLRVCC